MGQIYENIKTIKLKKRVWGWTHILVAPGAGPAKAQANAIHHTHPLQQPDLSKIQEEGLCAPSFSPRTQSLLTPTLELIALDIAAKEHACSSLHLSV